MLRQAPSSVTVAPVLAPALVAQAGLAATVTSMVAVEALGAGAPWAGAALRDWRRGWAVRLAARLLR